MSIPALFDDDKMNDCLAEQFRQGKESAFTCLYHHTFPTLSLLGKKLLDDEFMVSCILNECFLRAWQFRSRMRAYALIYRFIRFQLHWLCQRCYTDPTYQLHRNVILPDFWSLKEPGPGALLELSDAVSYADHKEQVDWPTSFLSSRRQRILHLVYRKSRTHQEVANQLKITVREVITELAESVAELKVIASRSSSGPNANRMDSYADNRAVNVSELALFKIRSGEKPSFDFIVKNLGLSPEQVITLYFRANTVAPCSGKAINAKKSSFK